MAVRTFGNIEFFIDKWIITEAEPHVCIKLKNIFPKINKTASQPFYFDDNPDNCHELLWFMDRYPLSIGRQDLKRMKAARELHLNDINERERILIPGYTPKPIVLNPGEKARDYQLMPSEILARVKKMLLGDDMGLGKTLSAIICMLWPERLPAVVVVQTHMQKQWVREITRFTNLTAHIVTVTKPYNLPPADVYIFKYTCLFGWTDLFSTGFSKRSYSMKSKN